MKITLKALEELVELGQMFRVSEDETTNRLSQNFLVSFFLLMVLNWPIPSTNISLHCVAGPKQAVTL